ncbi:MAG: hypothetical protein ACOC22_01290 [bacterium]
MNWRINLIIGLIILTITHIPRKIMSYLFKYDPDIYMWLDKYLPLI